MVLNREMDTEVGYLVELDDMCEVFRSLPHGGGILDQDHTLIRHLTLVRAAKAERRQLDQERQAKKQKG